MALKPPPIPPNISEVMQQVQELMGPAALAGEVDRNARQLVQSALRKLDFVSREEFDAQTAVLERTRGKIAALESELAAMQELVKELELSRGS